MTALLLSFASNPTIIAILAGIVGVIGWGFKQRLAGAAAERAKQAASEAKARDIADEIDNAVAGRTPEENRERLRKWSRS